MILACYEEKKKSTDTLAAPATLTFQSNPLRGSDRSYDTKFTIVQMHI